MTQTLVHLLHHFQQFLDDCQGHIWVSRAPEKVMSKMRKKRDMTGEFICAYFSCVTFALYCP
jgi:hypothetical protein